MKLTAQSSLRRKMTDVSGGHPAAGGPLTTAAVEEVRRERQMRRITAEMDDLRSKLERDKAEALAQQKEAMNRAFRVQLSKLLKEKEELVRKCSQLQSASKANTSGSSTGPSSPSGEVQRLVHEIAVLRTEKKKQEEQLQVMKESEQVRFENMRSLLDDKTRELMQLQKQLKQHIARLREECRTKDRVISHLECELRTQSGRAQQFRDILEQNLLSCNNKTGHLHHHHNGAAGAAEELTTTAREKQLEIRVADLEAALKEQQETFAREKRQLLQRISETEEQQSPLRRKNKQQLARNVQLTLEKHRLAQSFKAMEEQVGIIVTSTEDSVKKSITRPHVPSKSEKQRRMEYVQQIQKLRKEQRYYSMWELPPLLEVETDESGSGSDGSLSPVATSGVSSQSSSSSESAWSDETRRELEVLFSQLSREHGELQRNYQLLHEKLRQLTSFSETDYAANSLNYAALQADYTAARARIRDLEEILQLKKNQQEPKEQAKTAAVPSLLEIQAKFVREKHAMQTQLALLNHRLVEAKERHQAVMAELNEARDQNELLEFRILELEEAQEKASSQCCSTGHDATDRKDVCCATSEAMLMTTSDSGDDASSVAGDSGITSLASLVVDCPSPTLMAGASSSSSAGSSPDSDYLGEKISAAKAELQLILPSLNDAKHKSVLAQLQALLGVCQSRLFVARTRSLMEPSSHHHGWDQQPLQESGIFEEDRQRNSMADQAVQVTVQMADSSDQCEVEGEEKAVQASYAAIELAEMAEMSCQTEEPVMTLTDFRDIELYYVEQIELLQKEKAASRKKFQASRDETTQAVQQLELLARQFQEREKQFDDILQKNCQAFERELEAARKDANDGELSALQECLLTVWQEVRDFVSDAPAIPSSGPFNREFGQALISSLRRLCAELCQLRGKVVDLAEMEQAFQTTLRQADGLVHHIEEKHLRRIRELELIEQELRSQLEMAGQHPPASEEDDGSLQFKLEEMRRENEALTVQAGKCQELEDYCHQLHGRLEEYDQREKRFQQAVQEAERRYSVREQRYKEEVESLRSELDRCRESESTWRTRLEQREGQLSAMRSELEVEQHTIATLEAEVKDLQAKLSKDDTSFRNEVTKLRAQLNISLAQLNELESLNCALREQIVEHQNRISSLQRSLEMESCQSQDLAAENSRLIQAQAELMSHHHPSSSTIVMVGKPLTEELFEAETDDPPAVTVSTTTLDDFQEISLPSTPTVVDGCTDVFEEHFKVLESLESYLESQQLIGTAVSEDESGISTSPSIHENEPMALLEAQLSQLRTEKHFLLNSVVQSQKKDEIIQILIDQLKYNAPRQYLVETAAQIRRRIAQDAENNPDGDRHHRHHRDKEIESVCRLLEAPIDLSVAAEPSLDGQAISFASSDCVATSPAPPPRHHQPSCSRLARQITVTVLPDEDPLLRPASQLRVTRKVGQDGLVIAWLPSPDTECAGYLICINGQEAQRVRNANRTKAVLCGLDLQSEMDICIYSMSASGLVSRPDSTLYRPEERLTHSDSSSTPEPAGPSTTTPREVVVQTFYTNSSVTVRSSRRVLNGDPPGSPTGARIPVRPCVP